MAFPKGLSLMKELQRLNEFQWETADFRCMGKILSGTNQYQLLDLAGWKLERGMFLLISSPKFDNLYGLCLDNCVGLEIDHLRLLRGHNSIRKLSLVAMKVAINKELDGIFGSLRSLVYLNLTGCTVDNKSTTLLALSQSCSTLKTLLLAESKGVDNYVLNNLASCIERFRCLQVIDLSGCLEFSDEGLLVLIQASGSILSELNVDHCRQLTTLSLASLRGRMSALQTLNISRLLIGQTAYEWITEGCRALVHLNLTKASELSDEILVKIGRWCRFLQSLNIGNCVQITDDGIVGFFSKFDGGLTSLDLTGCVACSESSMTAITEHTNTIRALRCLKLNGLSHISGPRLVAFWNRTLVEGDLRTFEMSCALKSTVSHRRSMMPHFSDQVLLSLPDGLSKTRGGAFSMPRRKLKVLKIVGAGQVGDAGLPCFLQQSGETLTHLDVSYCHKVTDVSLIVIAQSCRVLETLILTGCVYITDLGLSALGAHDNYTDFSKIHDHSAYDEPDGQLLLLSTLARSSFFKSSHVGSVSSVTSVNKTPAVPPSLGNDVLRVEDLERSGSLPIMPSTALSAANSSNTISMNQLKSKSVLLKTGTSTLNFASKTNKLAKSRGEMMVPKSSVCRNSLHTIEVSGCGKITDVGVRNLVSGLRHQLVSLGIRSCDLITDKGIQSIARYCGSSLQSLDIMNLDFVTLQSIRSILARCQLLVTLNCDGCAFTPHEFASLLQRETNFPISPSYGIKGLIFSQVVTGRCRLEARPKPVLMFHRYLYSEAMRRHHAAIILQRFAYRALHYQEFLRSKTKGKAEMWRLRRIFLYLQIGIRKCRYDRRYEDRQQAIQVLQRELPRLYAVRLARRLLAKKKIIYVATLTLQRCYRGFSVRNRLHRRFTRLYFFYNKIGHLAHKYRVVCQARIVHRFILATQAFGRMVPVRVRFWLFRRGIVMLQRRVRGMLHKKQRLIQYRRRMAERAHALHLRRNAAASLLQRNLKAGLFNRMMAPFIFTCCVYARNEWDEQNWSTMLIQKRYRGWITRYCKYKAILEVSERYIAAKRIQVAWRRYRQYIKIYPVRIVPYRRAMYNMKRLFRRNRPRLCLGRRYVRRIQRWYRNWRLIWAREAAALQVQCCFRQYQARRRLREQFLARLETSAEIVKRALWKWHWKCFRRAMKRRQHMAAFRIYLMVEQPFQRRRAANRRLEEEKTHREEHRNEKQRVYMERCRQTVKRIRKRYRDQMSRRIQRFFRTYKPIMHAYYKVIMEERGFNVTSSAAALNTSGGAMDHTSGTKQSHATHAQDESGDADQSTMSRKVRAVLNTAVSKPMNLLKNVLRSTAAFVQPDELIPRKDERKLANAVLSYQVKTILQEGLIDLQLTVGDLEASNFELRQVQLRNASLPYFERIPEDLSHHLNLSVFLWVMYGTGKDCICELEISARPPNYSNAGMKVREDELRTRHVKLVWHPHTHFELRGERSIQLNKAAFAIQEIKIVNSLAEFESMTTLQTKYRLVQDMTSLGFNHVSVWLTGRKADEDEAMYKFNQITAYGWCDDRLIRTVKSFLLTEEDVFGMRKTFQRMLHGRNRSSVPNQDIFDYIGFKWNAIGQWACAAILPRRKRELSFSEYVHFVCYFIMLSGKDLARFLFTSSDPNQHGYLRKEQFTTLLNILAEGSPFNVKQWEYQYEEFHDRKLQFQFIGNFEDFIFQNPGALWQPQLLQQCLKKYNLGIKYWDKKMEQFRVIRENMGIKLL